MNTLFNKSNVDKLQGRIDNLQPDSKALWGKMTVSEMICHLSDPLRDILGIRQTKPVFPVLLRPLMKWMLLGKKPFGKNAPTAKPYLQAQNGGGTKPTSFDADRRELKNLLNRFAAIDSTTVLSTHAALGLLNKEEADILMSKHFEHHLGQFGV